MEVAPGVVLTLERVSGDSRCPQDVTCIHAGGQRNRQADHVATIRVTSERTLPLILGISNPLPPGVGARGSERAAEHLRDLGVKHIRLGVSWQTTEPVQGRFDWWQLGQNVRLASSHGLSLMLLIAATAPDWACKKRGMRGGCVPRDMRDFAAYIEAVAQAPSAGPSNALSADDPAVVRLGAIGLGRAFVLTLPGILADPRVRLVAGCDVRADARAAFAGRFDAFVVVFSHSEMHQGGPSTG